MTSNAANCPNSAALRLRRRRSMSHGRAHIVPVPNATVALWRFPSAFRGLVGEHGLRTLVLAGFVDLVPQTDGGQKVCVRSFLAHMKAASVPGFWNEDRTARYEVARRQRRATWSTPPDRNVA